MRADLYLSEFGYVKSRQNAKVLIEGGKVTLDGRVLTKPSEQIDERDEHTLEIIKEKYVCRGGYKLEVALEKFSELICVEGAVCIDIGASTGGFTDCLLQKGAEKVFAVDSGHGQLDESLLQNEKVVNIEGYNARNLRLQDFPCLMDVATMDVSFISQTLILPSIPNVLKSGGILVSLIKPQFEVGREFVGKNGIVKNAKKRDESVKRVVDFALSCGFELLRKTESPIKGGDGNTEFLAVFRLK
ncbi:MAG: TlyA family RNA methyltransferase [Clostridia bacterium]|nr:TlyA family RNA methyltransferase [Clostridia bacterium]